MLVNRHASFQSTGRRMSDARNRLEQAIAAQKGKPKGAAPAPAPPKPPSRQGAPPPSSVAPPLLNARPHLRSRRNLPRRPPRRRPPRRRLNPRRRSLLVQKSPASSPKHSPALSMSSRKPRARFLPRHFWAASAMGSSRSSPTSNLATMKFPSPGRPRAKLKLRPKAWTMSARWKQVARPILRAEQHRVNL